MPGASQYLEHGKPAIRRAAALAVPVGGRRGSAHNPRAASARGWPWSRPAQRCRVRRPRGDRPAAGSVSPGRLRRSDSDAGRDGDQRWPGPAGVV